MTPQTPESSAEFIRFLIAEKVLRFGEFKIKSGRISPYFFNTGTLADGAGLLRLVQRYAACLMSYERQHKIQFDMLFGPAYKGITLASATAIAMAQAGRNIPFAYNRKEAKDHGEGGVFVGSPIQGKVVIVDDVISAGTSVRESVNWIRQAGAEPAAVLICLDRMERGGNAEVLTALSAVQEVEREFGIPVIAALTLNDLMEFLQGGDPAVVTDQSDVAIYRDKVATYRSRYGVVA